jgi:hypothetical protein
MFWARRTPVSLFLALILYLTLAWTCVTGVGAVGEVGAAWRAAPPRVVVAWEGGEALLADGWRAGPLVAAQARPLERIELGPLSLPLAVNQYTGGPPEWPARLVWALTRSLGAVTGLHVALGGLLLILAHRFLRYHGTDVAAATAGLALASDWSFVFYRKVLSGTELLLQAAGLLVLWAFWSRRWSGGRHGTLAVAAGVGLGMMAKATFAATLVAFAAAALLTRWDRPALKPPPAPRWGAMLAVVAALTAPLWVSALHAAALPAELPMVRSHDFVDLQLARALDGLGGAAAAREQAASLLWFLVDPLAWFGPALGAPRPLSPSGWRIAALALLLAGTALEWRSRGNSPSAALLRFLSIYAPLQLLALWAANRDLHHLAQAAPTWCLWFGLAADRLAAPITQPRSPTRALYALALTLPWIVGGARALAETDAVVGAVEAPLFAEDRQAALIALLRAAEVERLAASDYELYGTLELRLEADGGRSVEVTHGWGALSRARGGGERSAAMAALLRDARGGHYLAVRKTAPRIYDSRPSEAALVGLAEEAGVTVEEVGRLEDRDGEWARLYRVR